MSEKVKVQIYLDPETAAKVDDLAEAMGNTRAGICTFCVTQTIGDDYWLVTHVAAPLRKVMDAGA